MTGITDPREGQPTKGLRPPEIGSTAQINLGGGPHAFVITDAGAGDAVAGVAIFHGAGAPPVGRYYPRVQRGRGVEQWCYPEDPERWWYLPSRFIPTTGPTPEVQ